MFSELTLETSEMKPRLTIMYYSTLPCLSCPAQLPNPPQPQSFSLFRNPFQFLAWLAGQPPHPIHSTCHTHSCYSASLPTLLGWLAGRLAGPAAQHSAAASPSPSPSSRRAGHDSIATLLEDTNTIDRTTVQFPFSSNPNWQTQNSIVQFNPPCSAAAVAAALPLSTPVSPAASTDLQPAPALNPVLPAAL